MRLEKMGMDRLSGRALHSRYDYNSLENAPHLADGGAPAACPGLPFLAFDFWHSTDEDIQQTPEVGTQLQTARQRRKARPGRCRSARAQAG